MFQKRAAINFIYPTVVGPRYSSGKEGPNSGFMASPYLKKGSRPSYDFDLKIRLAGGMRVQELFSKTHKISTQNEPGDVVNIALDPSEQAGGNRDFILEYGFRGDQIQTGLLTFDDGGEKFFLLMAQPPKSHETSQIPPREYLFVVDVSGSMRGFPLEISKNLLKKLISGLRPIDRFNILTFSGGNSLWAEKPLTATAENLQNAVDFLTKLEGSGGTELLPALNRVMALPRQSEGLSRSIVVITDGFVGVESEAFDLIRKNLGKSNLFAFGIGSSVNRFLIEGLARAGQGSPFFLTDQKMADVEVEKFRKYIASPLMTQISAKFEGFGAYDVEPLSIADVLSDRPILIFGKYKGPATGAIKLEGWAAGDSPATGFFEKAKNFFQNKSAHKTTLQFDVKNAQPDARNLALKYLWARERIRNVADFNQNGLSENQQKEVTDLGLKYSLLTAFTSFVAIEERPATAANGKLEKVNQPLPLPAGVENSAIGFDLGIEGMSGLGLVAVAVLPKNWILVAVFAFFFGLVAAFLFLKKKDRISAFFALFALISLSNCTKNETSDNPYQSVTILLGDDRSDRNPYFKTAKKYFENDPIEGTPIVTTTCPTLADAVDFLKKNRPATGPWQRIQLVAHGNEWTGMSFPATPGGKRCTTADIEAALKTGAIKPLADRAIDAQTAVTIFGCNVGKDTALLRAVSLALGGLDEARPTVRSARFFNIFSERNGLAERHLADNAFVAIPAGGFPGNRKIAEMLAKKYPSDPTDWPAALCRLRSERPGEPFVHYFNIPARWTAAYPNASDCPEICSPEAQLEWVRSQPELSALLEKMALPPEAFRWEFSETTVETPDGRKLPAIFAEGQTIIYSILKPLTNAEKTCFLRPAADDGQFYTSVR